MNTSLTNTGERPPFRSIPDAPSDLRHPQADCVLTRTVLHAEIMALNNARNCATQGDATTIYARIGDLIIERQKVLQSMQQGGDQ